jgi:hypothetical protein
MCPICKAPLKKINEDRNNLTFLCINNCYKVSRFQFDTSFTYYTSDKYQIIFCSDVPRNRTGLILRNVSLNEIIINEYNEMYKRLFKTFKSKSEIDEFCDKLILLR